MIGSHVPKCFTSFVFLFVFFARSRSEYSSNVAVTLILERRVTLGHTRPTNGMRSRTLPISQLSHVSFQATSHHLTCHLITNFFTPPPHSADATIASQATGAMSWAFITVLKKRPQQSYVQLLNSIRDELESRYTQKPQLSCSHPLSKSRPAAIRPPPLPPTPTLADTAG